MSAFLCAEEVAEEASQFVQLGKGRPSKQLCIIHYSRLKLVRQQVLKDATHLVMHTCSHVAGWTRRWQCIGGNGLTGWTRSLLLLEWQSEAIQPKPKHPRDTSDKTHHQHSLTSPTPSPFTPSFLHPRSCTGILSFNWCLISQLNKTLTYTCVYWTPEKDSCCIVPCPGAALVACAVGIRYWWLTVISFTSPAFPPLSCPFLLLLLT